MCLEVTFVLSVCTLKDLVESKMITGLKKEWYHHPLATLMWPVFFSQAVLSLASGAAPAPHVVTTRQDISLDHTTEHLTALRTKRPIRCSVKQAACHSAHIPDAAQHCLSINGRQQHVQWLGRVMVSDCLWRLWMVRWGGVCEGYWQTLILSAAHLQWRMVQTIVCTWTFPHED